MPYLLIRLPHNYFAYVAGCKHWIMWWIQQFDPKNHGIFFTIAWPRCAITIKKFTIWFYSLIIPCIYNYIYLHLEKFAEFEPCANSMQTLIMWWLYIYLSIEFKVTFSMPSLMQLGGWLMQLGGWLMQLGDWLLYNARSKSIHA